MLTHFVSDMCHRSEYCVYLQTGFSLGRIISLDNIIVKEHMLSKVLKDKKIVVLGDDPSCYLNSQLATPYFNWRISKIQLTELDYYDNIVDIYRNFKNDMPDVIVDQHDVDALSNI